ncbi:MAG TPA: type I phosphomannose isomerase catalytic subunit [Verrucomicrobiaceae bacterium]|jgi:mannose-6-phosphate isomerase
MSGLKPLRFQPIYHSRIWGGRHLESLFGRHLPDANPYGESWELCDRPEAQSVVQDGPLAGLTLHDLWTDRRVEIFGARHRDHPASRFPILLKILDCHDVLSLQVHPPAAIAPALGGEPKTEMWYVAHATEKALIYAGLRHGASREKFEAALIHGTAADLVHRITPREGEFMMVESGRIHALGAGLVVFEIQQNSDTTYRVFDWNRTGLDGKPRALHVAESMSCIDFDDFEPALGSPKPDGAMVECPFFATSFHSIASGKRSDFKLPDDDFACIAVVRGSGSLANERVGAGDFVLLPAGSNPWHLATDSAQMEWLEIRLPMPG